MYNLIFSYVYCLALVSYWLLLEEAPHLIFGKLV